MYLTPLILISSCYLYNSRQRTGIKKNWWSICIGDLKAFYVFIIMNIHFQIEISYRVSWRRSYGSQHYCNDSMISGSEYNYGEDSLECRYNCGTTFTILNRMEYKCTDYSADEDWTTGVNSVVMHFGALTDFYIGWDILNYKACKYLIMLICKKGYVKVQSPVCWAK